MQPFMVVKETTVKPRITMNMTAEGEFEIWVNEAGRDLRVTELQALCEKNDHFHLGAFDGTIGLQMQQLTYRPTDTLVDTAKVLFRTEGWDRGYFPRVLGNTVDESGG
jgi:hypothetical protein